MPQYPRRSGAFLALTALWLVALRAFAATPSPFELDAAARDPQWLRLLHMPTSGIGSGATSAIVSEDFFLSPRGATDPRRELEATYDAIMRPTRAKIPGNRHAQCRFPARTLYLVKTLGIERKAAPAPDCAAYLKWRAATNAAKDGEVAVIFAGYAADDPVGRLGHLFLRIGATPGQVAPLDLTVNYAINFPKDAGAFTKIAGSFLESFDSTVKLRPFYSYLDSYNNKDLRDIWQYALALDDVERRMLLAHLWELHRDVDLTYALLSHNCVTFLLALVEVARPTLDLQGRARRLPFPSDAIKALRAAPHLVKRIDYAPSGGRVFDEEYAALSGAQRTAFEAALSSSVVAPVEALPLAERAPVYQALGTHLLLGIRRAANAKDAAQVAALRKMRLLVLTSAKPAPVVLTAKRPGPEAGHGIRRLSVGGGAVIQGRDAAPYVSLHHRLLMHGRLDATDGFNPGDHFEGLDLKFRAYPLERRILLDELLLLDIETLPNVAAREFVPAKQIRLGIYGNFPDPRGDGYALYVKQGYGVAWFDPRAPTVIVHATLGYFATAARASDLRPELDTGLLAHFSRTMAVDAGAAYRPRLFRGYQADGRARLELRYLPRADFNAGLRVEYAVAAKLVDALGSVMWFY